MKARQKRQTPLAGGVSQSQSTEQTASIVAVSETDAKARIIRGRSSTEQGRVIIEALRIRAHTTDDFRKLGIFQISARIWELRKQGWDIRTDRITVVDRDSYSHPRAALYSLVEEVQP